MLDCLSLQGPVGLSIALYCTWVQCLDIICFNCKVKAGGSQLQEHSPDKLAMLCLSPQLHGWAASSMRDVVQHCAILALLLHRPQFLFKGVGQWQSKGKKGERDFRGDSVLTFCTL